MAASDLSSAVKENMESLLRDGMAKELLVRLHRSLLVGRCTEQTLAERYKEQEMRTPTHFGVGQEAVAVGVCEALNKKDVVYSHHRCHNHYLAKGGSVYKLASELYGRETGCSKGRGGSVHLTDLENGFVASSAILGETTALAVGSALAFVMDKQARVAATFFGDAVFEEGGLYECFNYASSKGLPVLFVCENNLYSTESPLSVRQPEGTDFCERARSFKVESVQVDGNDVLEVYAAALLLAGRCRSGQGPAFLECLTYRWLEHVGPLYDHDVGRIYRTKAEVESWMERCPVKRSSDRLVRLGMKSQQDMDRMAKEVQQEVVVAVEQAHSAPWPKINDLFENV